MEVQVGSETNLEVRSVKVEARQVPRSRRGLQTSVSGLGHGHHLQDGLFVEFVKEVALRSRPGFRELGKRLLDIAVRQEWRMLLRPL